MSQTITEEEFQKRMVSYKNKVLAEQARRAEEKKIVSIDAALEAQLKHFERLAEQSREFTQLHSAWAAGKAQTIECPLHKIQRPINWERSQRRSYDEHEMILVYKPCPNCLAARNTLDSSQWLKRLGVPANLLHCAFDNFVCKNQEDTENLETAKTFARARRGFLVMLGEKRGNGKSHLTVSILREIQKGNFVEGMTLFSQLHGGFERRERALSRCKDSPCLAVDEFGLSHGYDDELAFTHEIFNHRHGEKLKTIITGNFANKNEFYKAIGARMTDRLSESGFKMCWFTGDSRRPERKQAYFDETTDEVK